MLVDIVVEQHRLIDNHRGCCVLPYSPSRGRTRCLGERCSDDSALWCDHGLRFTGSSFVSGEEAFSPFRVLPFEVCLGLDDQRRVPDRWLKERLERLNAREGRVERCPCASARLMNPFTEVIAMTPFDTRAAHAASSQASSQEPTLPWTLPLTPETWPVDQARSVPLEAFDERLCRYRLACSQAEQQTMIGSLRRYGQLAPVTVVLQEGLVVLVDGFRRLQAARNVRSFSSLLARRIEVNEAGAKAAMLLLNQLSRRAGELEEAWIVRSLVRDEGLSQQQAAHLLGKHKSWATRRLALLEKLAPEALEEMQLGLLSPSMARQLVRLPVGNQIQALAVARRETLTATEFKGVVDLLIASGTNEQQAYVLAKPREALQHANGVGVRAWDPRLSVDGNRVNKRLASLLDQLARMENWLRHGAHAELNRCDRQVLAPGFEKLLHQTRLVAQAAEDFLPEIRD